MRQNAFAAIAGFQCGRFATIKANWKRELDYFQLKGAIEGPGFRRGGCGWAWTRGL